MTTDERGVVFLVHGVDADLDERKMPQWYQLARKELDTFFHIVEVRYRRYDRLGKAFVISLRGALAVAFACAAAIVWLGRASLLSIAAAVTLVVGGLLLSAYESSRRQATIREIAGQLGDGLQKGNGHHVIAHSFGTFLLPEALKHTIASLQHVVLAGSVLPRRYDWRTLWKRADNGPRRYHRVRNEYSADDYVAALAGMVWALTGCGCAGAKGFIDTTTEDEASIVHEVAAPYGPCSTRSEACSTAPIIHNVALGDYGHSDVFLSAAHARELWLPTLWSYEPHAYNDFVTRCCEIIRLYEAGFRTEARDRCEAMLDEAFEFFGADENVPRSIRFVVGAEAAARGTLFTDDELAAIVRTMAELVMSAWQRPDRPARKLAYPRRALASAMDHTLKNR